MPAPAPVWNGRDLLQAFAAAARWLDVNRDQVNALNVFPVPDGDTGTNMALTMAAALAAAEALDEDDQADAASVASKVAYGALMGARGNSGVILSQIFRGFAHGIDGHAEIDGRDLARALTAAKDMAYKAVMKPVEGTMLTVVRVAAERAEQAARRSPSMAPVFSAALAGAADALARTPEQLDILRQAGVVDAGGQGVVHVLEAMKRFSSGEAMPARSSETDGPIGTHMDFLDQVEELHGDDAYGYCTNFMVFGTDIDVDRCREQIAAMGTSAVIVGDETVLKVHIHVLNPAKVLDYAINLGELDQIKIDNMQTQTRDLAAERAKGEQRAGRDGHAEPSSDLIGRQAVLAVAAGKGLGDALRSMGASRIIAGGQTMNPSIEELLAAVEDAPGQDIIMLPNNPNILLTANQIPELTSKLVGIVPTRSVPQAIAALGAYNAEAELDENVEAMTQALGSVRTVELTSAVRDAEIDGIRVKTGQVIGLLDGRLVAAGDDLVSVCTRTVEAVDVDDHELITLFYGAEIDPDAAEALAKTLRACHPAMTVEVHDGGQPHYDFVIAIE